MEEGVSQVASEVSAMNTTGQPGDELFWDKVRRARLMSPEEKLLSGMRLHESACRATLDGIRDQHPGISDADALTMLKARIALRRKWNEIR
jgi:hypothetical protein